MLLDYQEFDTPQKTGTGSKQPRLQRATAEEKPAVVSAEEKKEAAGGVQPGGNGVE